MSATQCTCMRAGQLRRIVTDPHCPAWGIHVLHPEKVEEGSK